MVKGDILYNHTNGRLGVFLGETQNGMVSVCQVWVKRDGTLMRESRTTWPGKFVEMAKLSLFEACREESVRKQARAIADTM